MVCCDHQGTALPVPSYCLPWSSNPWVISCPITCTVLYSTVLYCTVHPHHADGAEVEVARVAALEERGLEDTGGEGCDDNIRRVYCTVLHRTVLYCTVLTDGVVVGGVPCVDDGGVHEPHVALRRLPQRDEVLLGRPAPHHHRLAEEALAVGVVGYRVPGGGLV